MMFRFGDVCPREGDHGLYAVIVVLAYLLLHCSEKQCVFLFLFLFSLKCKVWNGPSAEGHSDLRVCLSGRQDQGRFLR